MKRINRTSFPIAQSETLTEQIQPVDLAYQLPFYLVALGASAGGLEALNTFFDAMHSDNGLAFVVVQHLSPDYKSQMVELLKRRTSMPVAQVTDGVGVKANHVYVIPPNKCMVIFHGTLLLNPFIREPGPKLPIDYFFTALAQDQAERSIAICLSGTGSDGVRGIRAIKEVGGLVIVQEEHSALFGGMPHRAIATGMADCVLPPAEMPAFLRNFVNHPLLIRPRFNGWMPPEGALESDLLISVTQFFRDAEAFQLLKATVIPALFTNAEKDRLIRVWVPGCATGEEAYSVAADIGPDLLARYFTQEGDAYRVRWYLREKVIFATQNLLRDPPGGSCYDFEREPIEATECVPRQQRDGSPQGMRRPKIPPDSTLQQQAENVIARVNGGALRAQPFDLVSALEELRVYGAELEIQNEELVQSRAQAEASRKKYFQHFDLAPVAMIRLDHTGIIREANILGAAMLGVPRASIHASPIFFAARLAGEALDTFHRHLKLAFTSLKPEFCELSLRNAAGGETYVRLQSIASRGESDAPYLFVTLTDLTEHKRAEAERAALERTLLQRQKLENIGTLAGGIAHDFNNILQVIISRLSLAASLATSDGVLLEHIEEASRAVTQATSLSRRLLTFSKGGSPTKQALDVEEMLRSSVSFVLSGSPLKAEFSFEPSLPPVFVDPVQFGQVIENVVINAREATPGEGTVFIRARNGDRVTSADASRWVIIEIKDQGVGIPAAIQDRIFEVCFTTKAGNSGIGLATTKSIMEQHGGNVTIHSRIGRGTTVTLMLPATSQEPMPREAPLAIEVRKRLGRILLIDDEKMILEVVPLMLKGLGYECAVAECGIEGCDVYLRAKQEGKPFAAVLLDGTIPGGLGGKGALKLLLKADQHARVILCSGYANSDLFRRADELGFRGRLAKPFSVPELVATLNKVLA